MKRILKTILLIFLVLVLLAELTFIGYQEVIVKPGEELMQAKFVYKQVQIMYDILSDYLFSAGNKIKALRQEIHEYAVEDM